MKPHRGTLVLVFGILGIVSCWPLGLAAWLMGRKDLKEMDMGTMDPSGRGNTNAGRICGMIGTLWVAVVLLLSLGAAILWLLVSISPKHEKSIAPAKPPAPATEPAR